jgi:hypothetical protein
VLPFALTLAVAVTGYIIHNLQQRTYSGPTLPTQTVTNCLRYSSTSQNYGQAYYYQVQAYFEPILNDQNIAAFIGTKGEDCNLLLQTMKEAYQSGPWARAFFKITLGVNHQLKVTISAEIRKKYHIVGGSLPNVNTIILESLVNTATDQNKHLWDPARVLRHEMTHAFIKLFIKNKGVLSKFIEEAPNAFEKSLNTIERTRVDRFTYEEVQLVKHRAQLIKTQLQLYPDPARKAEEILTHLIQFVPEPLIKKYFPFFAKQIETMIAHFDHMSLKPHPEALDDDKWYTPNYAIDQQNYLTFKDINLEQPYVLGQQAMTAIYEKDLRTIEYFVEFFQHSDTKSRINALKNNNEHAYVECHLIAAQCYDFLGQHKLAYKHYNTAWKIDHSKTLETHQFNGDQLLRMFELEKMLKETDTPVKPPSQSMKRASNRLKS